MLGIVYANGQGVPRDDERSVHWYRVAAEQGFAPAQFNLGTCYVNGLGVHQDDATAAGWFRKAAEQGNVLAQSILGTSYALGRGVPQDYTKAVMWSFIASLEGGQKAKQGLALVKRYATASEVQEGKRLARDWLSTHKPTE
ncbi:MAG: hypothetical protein B7X43_00960 [Thiomonas sp. 15-63-373]|jgi:TPR repeat protein|nr:MAG: hypothetical protein B7X43_00960 [Thiomonas sp. 15-63-373]